MKARKLLIFGAIFFGALVVISAVIALVQKDLPLKEKIALVRIEGPIFSSKGIIEELKGYVKDNSIKAIVLRVDSPGGAVVPSQEIHDEVKKAAAKKKIVVSMGSVAASGGYYVAAPAHRIVANPGTITGSIGVIMEVPNLKGLMDKIGVRTEVIKSGRHKDMASAFRDIGREEREILQGLMTDVHEQFMEAVAESRKMPITEVRRLADGRVFSGKQAKGIGLVDDLGDLEYTIAAAAEMVGIKGEPEVVTKKERTSIMDLLSGSFREGLSRSLPSQSIELKYLFSP